VQILPGIVSHEATRVLAAMQQITAPVDIRAVTGDVLQDRMLVDIGIRFAEGCGLRDMLGASVFMHVLELQRSDQEATTHHVSHSQSEAHFLVFLDGAGVQGQVIVRRSQVVDQVVSLWPGDALLLPRGADFAFPPAGNGDAKWLQLGYADGSKAPDGGASGTGQGIRLWGPPGRARWRDLGLPPRGPNNAFALPLTSISLKDSTPGSLLAGRTDSLLDVRLSFADSAARAPSHMYESLVVPLDGQSPRFHPCLRGGSASSIEDGPALLLHWAAAPLFEAAANHDPADGLPASTTYLTGLSVTNSHLRSGERLSFGIAMGDRFLVVRSGSLVADGEAVTGPAVIVVPTGSFITYDATTDAELTEVLLERRQVELCPQVAVSAAAVVAFCIPLAPRDQTADWELAGRLFSATLRGIYAQSDPNWVIVAVGNEIPELTLPLDDRFHFISTTTDLTDGSLVGAFHDGSLKRRRAEIAARELGADYIYFSDWDDIIHSDFVKYIRSTRHPYGYVAGRGYIVDFALKDIGTFPVWGGGGSLDEVSTSTLVFNANAVNPILGETEPDYSGHLRHRYLMHAAGRPLMEIPFPAVAYMRFTSLNLSNALFAPATDGSQFAQLRKNVTAHSERSDATVWRSFGLDSLFGAAQAAAMQAVYSPKRLSVLICTHRRPDGLAALLASLVPQLVGHPEREIIVVNDGSHDASYSTVIGQFASAVRYLPLRSNVGIAKARNRAAEMALGEYLVFTDDDCEVPPSWLDWIDAELMSQPDLDVVAGYTRPLRPDGTGFMGRVQAAFDLLPRPYVLGEIDLSFVTACLAIRARSFRRAGGFATGASFALASEDTELAMRLARSGARIRLDPDWHVFHALATSLKSEMLRFRRYGYGNRQLARLPHRPPSHQYLLSLKYRRLLHYFIGHFRRNSAMAEQFKGSRLQRLAARCAAALVSTAYDFGALTNRPR